MLDLENSEISVVIFYGWNYRSQIFSIYFHKKLNIEFNKYNKGSLRVSEENEVPISSHNMGPLVDIQTAVKPLRRKNDKFTRF